MINMSQFRFPLNPARISPYVKNPTPYRDGDLSSLSIARPAGLPNPMATPRMTTGLPNPGLSSPMIAPRSSLGGDQNMQVFGEAIKMRNNWKIPTSGGAFGGIRPGIGHFMDQARRNLRL